MKKWGCIIVLLGMFLWVSSSQAELVQIGPEGWWVDERGVSDGWPKPMSLVMTPNWFRVNRNDTMGEVYNNNIPVPPGALALAYSWTAYAMFQPGSMMVPVASISPGLSILTDWYYNPAFPGDFSDSAYTVIANVNGNIKTFNSPVYYDSGNVYIDLLPSVKSIGILMDGGFSQEQTGWFGTSGFYFDVYPFVEPNSPYITTMTLGNTLSFDYYWKMGITPPPYQQGNMFDVLALQGGSGWQFIGQIDAYGSSTGWNTAMLNVPQNLQGTDAQVRFVLTDYYPETDPTVYLNNINPVPEPSTMLLLGSGLIGLWGFRKKFKN